MTVRKLKSDRSRYFLPTEHRSKVVIHVLSSTKSAIVLEQYPFAAPVFMITRNEPGSWSVDVEYDIGFTEAMLQNLDVVEFMVTARHFIDPLTIGTIRDTATRLLEHWAKTFPEGPKEYSVCSSSVDIALPKR